MVSNICKRRQVCLFGTSANPPTGNGGHVLIAKTLSEIESFDEVRVLPVYRHNFSSKRHQLISFEHRVNMCKIAFCDVPKAMVSTAEKTIFERLSENLPEQEKSSLRVGTAELLETLIEEEPDTDFSFCLGADTFLDLTAWKWRRSKDVLKLLDGRLVVMNRKGISGDLMDRINAVNRDEKANAILLDVPGLSDVSSSAVRNATSIESLQGMVTEGVIQYMIDNNLYFLEHAAKNDSI